MKLTTVLYIGIALLLIGLGVLTYSIYLSLDPTLEAIGKILIILGVVIDMCVVLPFVIPMCWCGEQR
jgi:hypothetical protein